MADVEAIEEVLLRISWLAEEILEINELDLNPVFALPEGQGCKIVDARIRIDSSASPKIQGGGSPIERSLRVRRHGNVFSQA